MLNARQGVTKSHQNSTGQIVKSGVQMSSQTVDRA